MPMIGGKNVTHESAGYAAWDEGHDKWHLNWKLACENKKRGASPIFHATKSTNQGGSSKVHYFFYTEIGRAGTEITSCVCPKGWKGEPGETKKFDDVPQAIRTWIETNYDALFQVGNP